MRHPGLSCAKSAVVPPRVPSALKSTEKAGYTPYHNRGFLRTPMCRIERVRLAVCKGGAKEAHVGHTRSPFMICMTFRVDGFLVCSIYITCRSCCRVRVHDLAHTSWVVYRIDLHYLDCDISGDCRVVTVDYASTSVLHCSGLGVCIASTIKSTNFRVCDDTGRSDGSACCVLHWCRFGRRPEAKHHSSFTNN